MSKQYNKSVFVGHLGGEPEMRYTPAGKAVKTFNVRLASGANTCIDSLASASPGSPLQAAK